jgi:hypothetical protein
MIGRYAYFKNSDYRDVSVKGEFAPLTNPSSLINILSGSLFKNIDFYPDPLTFNYTDVEFRYEPDKLTIDEITLNLFYMVPYTLYVTSQKNVSTSALSSSTSITSTPVFDKEDILLDLNNIPHKDILYDLSDDSVEYIIAPQVTDWNLLLSYMEKSRRS